MCKSRPALSQIRWLTADIIGELLGGEDRVDTVVSYTSGDGLICNFGSEYWENVTPLLPAYPCSLPVRALANIGLCSSQHNIQPRDFDNW